ILEAAQVGPGDLVLEVGPGTGVLSQRLLEAGANLVLVEIDRDLELILRSQLPVDGERCRLLVQDVLAGKHQLHPAVLEALGGRPFKLVANLPYNVASPLLANLAMDCPAMSAAIVMVQREVAQRLVAHPGGKDYGPLGILVQALCEVRNVTTLSPGCFWPSPGVDSTVLCITRRSVPLTDDPHQLSALLHRLFNQRRKQLGSILGRATALPDDVSPSARPEQLSLDQLVRLSRWIDAPPAGA
ncbi:MAG: ribosomal RNA small subunit methyltransferase A, partial [Phycisphaeraceae bacterium]|nr:ribosomal RNA small subunit methyltransferase A [Phycisphaeraceae bacterium]